MNSATLLRRNLFHHWRVNLAVVLGVAVGTSVLTGALLVGDSVRGSLRELTLDRLGSVDHALVSDRFFSDKLPERLQQSKNFKNLFESLNAGIMVRGTVISADSQRRAGGVQVLGVNEEFWNLNRSKVPEDSLPTGREVALNETLARELGVEAGEAVLVRIEKPSAVPRETILGRRSDTVRTLRLRVKIILPDRGLGRFGFQAQQQLPRNAFVPLATLQRGVEHESQVNALFVTGREEQDSKSATAAERLQGILAAGVTLDDLGLRLKRHATATGTGGEYLYLESEEMVLRPSIAKTALDAAAELKAETSSVFTYLANTMAAGERSVPYSTVSGLDTASGAPFGPLQFTNEKHALPIKDDEILLNEWAVEDLQAQPGDNIALDYFEVGNRGELYEKRTHFRLRGVVRLTGAAADPSLTPQFPGIHDAENMADWDPPFPVDLSRVRPRDEDYWDLHRATPKAFVSLATAQKLWTSRFGALTSLRVAAAEDISLSETEKRYRRLLLERIHPEQTGLIFLPVKAQGLAATTGSTDFGMLFVGFAMFLIVAAAMLTALLFRLSIERRSKEVGLLTATGHTNAFLRRLFLIEGFALATVGSFLGLAGAVGYGRLMVYGLQNWWQAAIGTPFVSLHVTGLSLGIGFTASLAVILFSILLAVRQLGEASPKTLLAGYAFSEQTAARRRRSRKPQWTAGVAVTLAIVMVVISLISENVPALAAFYICGVAMLTAALAGLTALLKKDQSESTVGGKGNKTGLARLGARNAARLPGRSVLTAGLVACASFVIVTVALNRQDPASEAPHKESGNGGFSLVAESDLGLHHDLNTAEGRRDLDLFEDDEEAVLSRSEILPFRLRPGEDVSCLNLYRPTRPRILGVTRNMVERGGFDFQSSLSETEEEAANPWRLLEKNYPDGVIPAVGDANTVMWILHLGLGGEMPITDENGSPARLKIVGLLRRSVFQSELLISEANFLKLFPHQSGFHFFMVETPQTEAAKVNQILEEKLAEFGLDVTTTGERLAGFLVVENTYLSTFQALGALGLLLGTLGLATLILRNVVERRGELALLQALGFGRGAVTWLLVSENAFLLLFGLAAGTLSAVVAVLPHLVATGANLPWLSLMFTLLLVLAVGLGTGAAVAAFTLRAPLPSALRSE